MSLPKTYAADDYWRRYLPFLPEVLRLPQDSVEEWWTWRGSQVHLDRNDAEDAPLKVIVLHGGGGTGRLVGAFGALVHSLGYSYVAPDLPGFGLTVLGSDYDPHYRSWVERDAVIIGTAAGYTAQQHLNCSDEVLRKARGFSALRMSLIQMVSGSLWRFLNAIENGDFYLQSIAVASECRGECIGSMLIDAMEERATGTDATS